MHKGDFLDATGYKPQDTKRLSDGKVRICIVSAMKVNGDYETCLRWNTPKTGDQLRRCRKHID